MINNNVPSENLLFLIEMMNFVPIRDGELVDGLFRVQLRYLHEKGRPLHEFDDEFDEDFYYKIQKEEVIEMKEYLVEFPELLLYLNEQAFILDEYYLQKGGKPDSDSSFLVVWSRYVAARNKLLGIVHKAKKLIKDNEKIGFWTPPRSQQFGLDLEFEIGDDYSLEIKGDYVDHALKGIDIRRIRHCGHCTHLFWAYRLDKFTCSIKCGQNFRTKRFREKQNNRFQSRIKKDVSL